MNFTIISNNIYVDNNYSINNVSSKLVHDLLKQVDLNFAQALNIEPFSSRQTFVTLSETQTPMCCTFMRGAHLIKLTAKESIGQLLFQFSHEYCHHLIDGNMSGDIYDLLWLEETICEVSSMYNLQTIYKIWSSSPNEEYNRQSYAFIIYLQIILENGEEELFNTLSSKGLFGWIPEYLARYKKKNRPMRNDVAVQIFPLFIENPHLWKIILHFGDMRRWNSLEELFQHLQKKATPDYSDSLEKLRSLLLA